MAIKNAMKEERMKPSTPTKNLSFAKIHAKRKKTHIVSDSVSIQFLLKFDFHFHILILFI